MRRWAGLEVAEQQSASVRALARAVPGRAVDARGEERVIASPTRYEDVGDPVAPHIAVRTTLGHDVRERRSRLLAPTNVLASTVAEERDDTAGERLMPTDAPRSAARVTEATGLPQARRVTAPAVSP